MKGPAFETPETMFSDPGNPHLGGYIKGGDYASFYPEMWLWALEELHVRSVLDIGCGEGHSLKWFRDQGCEVLGLEGVPQDDDDIIEHDFTTGPYMPASRFDLGWCCEFVEHVEERFLGNFLVTLHACRYVLMTHAVPGQGGHHHVNCQDDAYWIHALASVGFRYSPYLTAETRSRIEVERGYYRWSGLAFRRTC